MPRATIVERIAVDPVSLFYREHLARYEFAAEQIRPGRTLDIACGTGYGAALLRDRLGVPVGVDVDELTVAGARRTYGTDRLGFVVADGCVLPFAAGLFRNVVTLETIEHVADDHGFIGELARVMGADGVLVLSTPNRAYSLREGRVNPYHVREYDGEDLLALLRPHFGRVD